MANHITNVLTLDGIGDDGVEKLKTLLADDGETLDFDKIIPQPEFSGDQVDAEGYNYQLPDWYTWRVQHWGTKWNAYDGETDGDGWFRFLTAWSTPMPVIEALSNMFPDAVVNLAFYDEDLGSNLGCYSFENGVLVGSFLPESCSVEAKEFLLNEFGIDMDEEY